MALIMLLTALVYWPGLYGGWLFDDYPNIVDNQGVQPDGLSVANLTKVALSSPASDFKRPLSSLSFAANFLAAGLDPFWMKLTNLAIHLLNGALIFLLVRKLAYVVEPNRPKNGATIALLVAAGWLLLPINLTSVLYVVQRMESLANLFVLAGLISYTACRQRMIEGDGRWSLFALCATNLAVMTGLGVLAKETAVMLPLYALLIEWLVFGFKATLKPKVDGRIIGLFVIVLVLPMLAGLAWLAPGLMNSASWTVRDFTMSTRLLTEARVVLGYIAWCLIPLPSSLSFYHDNYVISTGLLSPWTTLASAAALIGLSSLAVVWRKHRPLASLGIALFLGCHLLTGTVLPLELVYEHRNYFASFGLLLALMVLLAPPQYTSKWHRTGNAIGASLLIGTLFLWWIALTAVSSYAWGNSLTLAKMLADRDPESPRAQYELGRTYIIYSGYDPSSAYTELAYAPLERAASLPRSSILPQQALIFMNARMNRPLKEAWWDTMIDKLHSRKPGVQDESSLIALTQCATEERCNLPKARMISAFMAAINHPSPSGRLLAAYGDYAWNVLGDKALAVQRTEQAVQASPREPAYRITLIRMLVAVGKRDQAVEEFGKLKALNLGGYLDASIAELGRKLRVPQASQDQL